MIQARDFLAAAQGRGIDFLAGVPCSFLTPFINTAISSPEFRYVGAASEGEAVGVAAGAWLAGRLPIVMCQNSGLGNMVNPLTSLNYPFRIPLLLIVTWRGQPGQKDEPQHELMGEITHALLDTMRIPHLPFPRTESGIAPALDAALDAMDERQLPFALVMEKDSVADSDLAPSISRPPERTGVVRRIAGGSLPSRESVLRVAEALAAAAGAAVVATTGKTGRELFTIADRPNHIYQVGSMGCAAGMGLGIALNSTRPVVVLDGDGAALMKLGTLATIGAQHPPNLVHVVLDNGVHDSTGGQATVSATTRFAEVAAACSYESAAETDTAEDFRHLLAEALATPGPHMIHVRIAPGSMAVLGRPTVAPDAVARRMQGFLAGT